VATPVLYTPTFVIQEFVRFVYFGLPPWALIGGMGPLGPMGPLQPHGPSGPCRRLAAGVAWRPNSIARLFRVDWNTGFAKVLVAEQIPMFFTSKANCPRARFGHHIGAHIAATGNSPGTRMRVKNNKRHGSGQGFIFLTWYCLVYSVNHMFQSPIIVDLSTLP